MAEADYESLSREELIARLEQLERASSEDELRRSNADLESFCRAASHDLRAPLRGIRNTLDWLKEDCDLDETGAGYVQTAQSRVDRMERLILDLLEYARVGKGQMESEPIDLTAMARDIFEELAAPETFNFQATELPVVQSRRVPLELALRNLLSNAVKHRTSDAGTIEVTATVRSDVLSLTIADDGPGIDPRNHERVFEPFTTLQSQDKVEGSGIGLALVKRAAESVGGSVAIDSSLGAGSRFTVTWPLRDAPPTPATPSSKLARYSDQAYVEWLEDHYENAPDMFVSVNPRSAVVERCNTTLVQRLGFANKGEIIGRPIFDLYHPDCHPSVSAAFDRFVSEGVVTNFRLDLLCKDGGKLPVLLNVHAKRNEAGEVVGSRSVWTDISSLVAAESVIEGLSTTKDRLRRQIELHEMVAEGTSVGIWDWVDVNREHEVWTPRFYRLLGYEPGEISASVPSFTALLHPDDRERTFKLVEDHFAGQSPFDLNYRLKCKDGSYRWFRGTGAVSRNSLGKPVRMVGSIQDIHEEVSARKRVEKANSDLLAFSRATAHDLKTPIRGLEILIGFLAEDQPLTAESQDHVAQMRKRIARVYELLSGIGQYTRAGTREYEISEVDCLSLARRVASNMDLPASVDVRVSGESIRLETTAPPVEEALRQIIKNAYQHGRSSAHQIDVEVLEGERSVTFAITDNGPGIPPKHRERVFRAFETLEPRDKGGGAGLGLPIAQKTVEPLGGQIRLTESPAGGCRFELEWPKSLVHRGKIRNGR